MRETFAYAGHHMPIRSNRRRLKDYDTWVLCGLVCIVVGFTALFAYILMPATDDTSTVDRRSSLTFKHSGETTGSGATKR
jgi:hypothetical protein